MDRPRSEGMSGESARVDWSVLVGPSPRLAGLEGPLAAFAGAIDEDVEVGVGALEDLARLLPGFAGPGRVLIDVDHVESEDIGLVRRFLATNPDWSVVLFGDDASRRTARVLSSLERTQWQAWPPDLDQLRTIVCTPFTKTESETAAQTPLMTHLTGGRDRAEELELAEVAERLESSFARIRREGSSDEALRHHERELARLSRLAGRDRDGRDEREIVLQPASTSQFDVAELLEEKLAALAVRGRQAPRYHFTGDGPLFVVGDAEAVGGAFDTFLRLARLCAGPGEVVRVQAVAQTSSGAACVDVTLSWPPGLLEELDPTDALLPGRVAEHLPGMESHDIAAAARTLEAAGGSIELRADERGRWKAAVRLRQPNHPSGRSTVAVGGS